MLVIKVVPGEAERNIDLETETKANGYTRTYGNLVEQPDNSSGLAPGGAIHVIFRSAYIVGSLSPIASTSYLQYITTPYHIQWTVRSPGRQSSKRI